MFIVKNGLTKWCLKASFIYDASYTFTTTPHTLLFDLYAQ